MEHLLPFAFPASVIAMLLLLLCLLSGVLKAEHIQEKSDFLLPDRSAGKYGFFLYSGRSKCHQLPGYSKSKLAASPGYLPGDYGNHLCRYCAQYPAHGAIAP